MTNDQFQDALVEYVNGHLLRSGARPVGATTALFAAGYMDSMKLLYLLAYVEKLRGDEIPDDDIVMDRFASISRVVAHFGPGAG